MLHPQSVPTAPLITGRRCPHNKCCSWNVLDPYFDSPVPKNYPTTYDTRENAPMPPTGREIFIGNPSSSVIRDDSDIANKRQRLEQALVPRTKLPGIKLSVGWLEQAVRFAQHNAKTNPPGSRANKRYWTKANLSAYLRSCGINTRLVMSTYQSAKKKDTTIHDVFQPAPKQKKSN